MEKFSNYGTTFDTAAQRKKKIYGYYWTSPICFRDNSDINLQNNRAYDNQGEGTSLTSTLSEKKSQQL